ncbi:hypothetical protein vBPaePE220_00067 [Pseudomonas phage vB_PaeP_E220]|uniref:Uncharacterized protein n=1 Tax=Pseudomonas phage vB_PaeP_E220 TaxID=2034343 RepID=A0A2K8IBS1_9CAUD|nr:hypothetical protein QGM56_gp67 [Pseudomonas phage vB_PaeP_E220]ASZ72207.1 hypothetical protein vBPaePE220_00067 [Pseudomonas phage vB_PaeP_E220]
MARHALPWLGHRAVETHDAAGRFVALGDQRAPLQDLFHVLQADHPGPAAELLELAGPLHNNPGQVADLFLARLAAGGLAVVPAVR